MADHVPPPPAVPPDGHAEEYAFDRLGVRMPALLISPWVDRRVEKTQFDHTSLLKYLVDKWGLGPLGQRTAHATSIAVALRRTAPRAFGDSVSRIELAQDELVTPDPDLAERSASSFDGQKGALQVPPDVRRAGGLARRLRDGARL